MIFKRRTLFRILTIILASGTLSSCEEIGNPPELPLAAFDTDYYEMDFYVQPNDRTGFQIFAEEFFSNDLDSIFGMLGYATDQIEEVILKEARISLEESGNYSDFSILRFMEMTLYTDSLGETKIAWSDPMPAEQSSVSLDLSDENILPYFMEKEFMLTAQGYLLERINEEMKLHAKVKFLVKGRL